MNDFTKTDLREIHRCLKYMTKGGITPYSCHTIALVKKVRTMIEKYCNHKDVTMDCDGGISLVCAKCGHTVMDV